jgi:hypothetical protein
MWSGQKRARAPEKRGGVRVQAPLARVRRSRRDGPTPRRGTPPPARTRGPRRPTAATGGCWLGAGARTSAADRVTSIEVAGQVTLRGVTPGRGEGALGTALARQDDPKAGLWAGAGGKRRLGLPAKSPRRMRGVGGRALQPRAIGAGVAAITPAERWRPTGRGTSDRPGGEGGVRTRELWRNEAPAAHTAKGQVGHALPKVARAVFLPDERGISAQGELGNVGEPPISLTIGPDWGTGRPKAMA